MPVAFEMAKGWAGDYGDRLVLVEGTFSDLDQYVDEPLDGVVLDLGVSSMQLDQAERESRPVHVLSTAPRTPSEPIQISDLMRASAAREIAAGLQPKPWPVDRAQALAAIGDLQIDGSAHVVWLSDGVGDADAAALAARLQRLGSLVVIEQPTASARPARTAIRCVSPSSVCPVHRSSRCGSVQ